VKGTLRKLQKGEKWRKIAVERLTEPLHINLLSAFIALFGSYRAKVSFDLVIRPQYAYPMLRSAEMAREQGLKAVTVVEFGVAAGDGLLNLCAIAARLTQTTGVHFHVAGFDTGRGMPPPVDYRDHPELYQGGDFPMVDPEALRAAMPANAQLALGELSHTVPALMETLSEEAPLGFVALDVDYYSSSKDALELLAHPNPLKYLPLPIIYLDDIMFENHNSWCGELLAVQDFNNGHALRKIEQDRFLRSRRVCKNPRWLDQIYLLHVLDHPRMNQLRCERAPRELNNPF
jgi:hypothetical protein